MALIRRTLKPTDFALVVGSLVVSTWPLFKGVIEPLFFGLFLVVGAAVGFGTGVFVRKAPRAWLVAPLAMSVPTIWLNLTVEKDSGWVYAWGFIAFAVLAASLFAATSENERR